MKSTLFTTSLALLFATNLFAQTSLQKPFVFGTFGVMGGINSGMINLSLDVISRSNYFYSGGFRIQYQDANVPDDYYGGILHGLSYPLTKTTSFSALFGKVMNTKSPRCRFILSGGVTIGAFQKPVNFKENDWQPANLGEAIVGAIFESNYTFDYKRGVAAGLIVNPKVDFPLLRGAGISVGPTAHLNTSGSTMGLEVSLHFGRLRDRVRR